jgi:hypothetical protein
MPKNIMAAIENAGDTSTVYVLAEAYQERINTEQPLQGYDDRMKNALIAAGYCAPRHF